MPRRPAVLLLLLLGSLAVLPRAAADPSGFHLYPPAALEAARGPGEEDAAGAEVESEETETALEETAAAEGEQDEAVRQGAPRGGYLPRIDVFFPEGDLDLRVNRLVDKVFFEGQVQYNFVDGDISAFLRYRYYGFRRTYQITGFDSVEFEGLEELEDEFERTRGFLVLTEWPFDYHRRAFFLAEIDRIISNKEALRFDNNRTNTFLRLGYQLGTPNDSRSNAIIGERRAEIRRLFTAYREIGPGGAGFTAGLTWGFDFGPGNYDYVKLEMDTLRRFDLPFGGNFLVGRLHGGSFVHKRFKPAADELQPPDRYTIPRAELFRLDGRDNLKGVSDRVRGTEQLYGTLEWVHPWFVGEKRHAVWLDWDSWYWIFYAGLGTAGFDGDVYGDLSGYYPDVGIGFESSFRHRKYTFFLSGIVARAFEGEGDVEAKLSIKSYH